MPYLHAARRRDGLLRIGDQTSLYVYLLVRHRQLHRHRLRVEAAVLLVVDPHLIEPNSTSGKDVGGDAEDVAPEGVGVRLEVQVKRLVGNEQVRVYGRKEA